MDGSTLGKYGGTELVSPKGSTEGTTDGNIEVFFLSDLLGSIDGLDFGTNFANKLRLSDGKVLGRTLGDLVGI